PQPPLALAGGLDRAGQGPRRPVELQREQPEAAGPEGQPRLRQRQQEQGGEEHQQGAAGDGQRPDREGPPAVAATARLDAFEGLARKPRAHSRPAYSEQPGSRRLLNASAVAPGKGWTPGA